MGAGPNWTQQETVELLDLYRLKLVTASDISTLLHWVGYPQRSVNAIYTKLKELLKNKPDRPRKISSPTGHRLIDLTGQVFGRLTVLRRVKTSRTRQALWECQCQCTRILMVRSFSLRRGISKSCGCSRRVAATAAPGADQPSSSTVN